jgi:hypothetical protein
VTYRMRLAIVGDMRQHLEESSALRDFLWSRIAGVRCGLLLIARNWSSDSLVTRDFSSTFRRSFLRLGATVEDTRWQCLRLVNEASELLR